MYCDVTGMECSKREAYKSSMCRCTDGEEPREGANYDKFIKSSLYSPPSQYHLLGPEQKAKLKNLNPVALLWSLLPDLENLAISQLPSVQTKFGAAPKGSVLSSQQGLTEKYVLPTLHSLSCPCLVQVKGLKTMCQFVWTTTNLRC